MSARWEYCKEEEATYDLQHAWRLLDKNDEELAVLRWSRSWREFILMSAGVTDWRYIPKKVARRLSDAESAMRYAQTVVAEEFGIKAANILRLKEALEQCD